MKECERETEKKPAIGSNGSKSISSETFTRSKNQNSEVFKRFSDKVQAIISDDHPLKSDLLQTRIRNSHSFDPRTNITTPTFRYQIEVRKVRFPFQCYRSHLRKPFYHHQRTHRVTVTDEHPPPAPPLDLIPRLAYKRDRASVCVRFNEREHVFENFFREWVRYSLHNDVVNWINDEKSSGTLPYEEVRSLPSWL